MIDGGVSCSGWRPTRSDYGETECQESSDIVAQLLATSRAESFQRVPAVPFEDVIHIGERNACEESRFGRRAIAGLRGHQARPGLLLANDLDSSTDPDGNFRTERAGPALVPTGGSGGPVAPRAPSAFGRSSILTRTDRDIQSGFRGMWAIGMTKNS